MIAWLRRKPYGALLPWMALAGLLGAGFAAVQLLVVAPAQARLEQAEAQWRATREKVAKRLEAKEARKDLTVVMNVLPAHRDFVQLPFAISQAAKRDRVSIPNLSSSLDKAKADLFTNAMLRGAVTGRYEDLRRFLHHLEQAEGFLFIENLDVGRQSNKKVESVTFNMTLRTYIRDGPAPNPAARSVAP